MPDKPAPMTRTSRCSRALMGTGSGCRTRDELVVQRAVLAEEALAPLGDQLGVVVVARVEAGAVVGAQGAEQLAVAQWALLEPLPALAEPTLLVRRLVAREGVDDGHGEAAEEAHEDAVHRPATHALGAAGGAIDVERDGLVLGLLQRVPHEQVASGGLAEHGPGALVGEEQLGERGGEVLER